jgi:hypothetical protein
MAPVTQSKVSGIPARIDIFRMVQFVGTMLANKENNSAIAKNIQEKNSQPQK